MCASNTVGVGLHTGPLDSVVSPLRRAHVKENHHVLDEKPAVVCACGDGGVFRYCHELKSKQLYFSFKNISTPFYDKKQKSFTVI